MMFKSDSSKLKHLIINIDVNGTILGEDKAKGESPEFGALKMICEGLEHDAWTVKNAKGEVRTRDYKNYVENKYSALKKADPVKYNQAVLEDFLSLTKPEHQAEFIEKIGPQKYAEILTNLPKITSQQSLFNSFKYLYESLKTSKRPFTIVFHTFGKDVKKVHATMTELAGQDAADNMPYVSFPSIKTTPDSIYFI